jgi:chemotaxis protein CheZ
MNDESTAATEDSAELKDLFDSIAMERDWSPDMAGLARPERAADAPISTTARVLNSVGHLTRQLHDTLAELGYDKHIQECTAGALPDARQRLAYVVSVTEQAASRSLNAVELASPVQESLAADASALSGRWDRVFRGESDVGEFKALASSTRDFLKAVPARTETTREHLSEIVMAQEFQDLTGQVLKRVTELASHLETQLVKLLVENTPAPTKHTPASRLLNGPAIDVAADVVANQAQVDELLESLGF